MNNRRFILITLILVILGIGLIGVYLMKPTPQSTLLADGGLLWEGFYTNAVYYLDPAPQLISNQWTYTETDTLTINVRIEIGISDYYGPTEYITEVQLVIEANRPVHPEVSGEIVISTLTLMENQQTFTLKGTINNELGRHRILVNVKTFFHPTFERNPLELNMKGPAYPLQDITGGSWSAIGAVESEEEGGIVEEVVGEATGFELLFTLIPIILIYKKKRRTKENGRTKI